MDNQEYGKVSKEIRNYKIARMNVLLFIVFTVLNLFMLLIDRYFLFSVYTVLVCLATGFGLKEAAIEAGAASPNLYLGIGIAFGLAILAVFFVMWLLSKKRRWAMIVLLVLFSLDSAVVLGGMIYLGDFTMLIDLAIHGVMLYYLILGVKASGELQKHFPEGVSLTVERLDEAYRLETGTDPVTGAPVNGIAAAEAAHVEKTDKPDSPVIEEDTPKGRVVLQATYNNSVVKVKASSFVWGKAKIIIDGKVYACEKVGGYKSKDISAVVNGVEYTYKYEYSFSKISHYLLAGNQTIARKDQVNGF